MVSNLRPAALAAAIIVSVAFSACFSSSLFSSTSRKDVLAMKLNTGRYGTQIDAAIDSGKLTDDEVEMLRGFHSRYATEPFYAGKFPDGITVKEAIRDERKYVHDADPSPHGPFIENDNETGE